MTPAEIQAIVTEISAAIEKAKWRKIDGPFGQPAYDAEANAETDGWRLLVVEMPAGSPVRTADGSAGKESKALVVRLTPDQAKRAVELAREQTRIL